MAKIFPFKGLCPNKDYAKIVATLPYDVVNTQEAAQQKDNPYHFYHVTRSEIDLPENIDAHSELVYKRAAENLQRMINDGILIQDTSEALYIYELTMNGRVQTGLVCGTAISDYDNGLIKKHEHTRPDKENDRINHIHTTKAQTGIIFLAYRDIASITTIINKWKQNHETMYDFVADDNILHKIWKITDNETIQVLQQLFDSEVPHSYIADGHHRSAALSKLHHANQHLGESNPYKYILSGFFPESELLIMDYNRVIKDLNGLSVDDFLDAIADKFELTEILQRPINKPEAIHQFKMYINGRWYDLKAKIDSYNPADILSSLDVNILQHNILSPILNIDDPRTNPNIDFVGGIRGIMALQEMVDNGQAVAAFACYPVSIQQLFSIADANEVMPPKSTWFEPKTRDGLIVLQTFEQN
jgi:uncharacterized protein (DUF1015 family)